MPHLTAGDDEARRLWAMTLREDQRALALGQRYSIAAAAEIPGTDIFDRVRSPGLGRKQGK